MSTQTPVVSIIAINYNSIADTLEFLESVDRTTYPAKEIIVIDNASKENPAEAIRRNFPGVKFIRSESNLGFAGGNNIGIDQATGKYLFFLNNDTLLPQDFFEPIVAFMEQHPEVGMASPKILYPDDKTIQYVGSIGISPYTGRGKRIAVLQQDAGQYDKCYPTDLAHGAALVVPSHVVKEVGRMPEIYFLYYEEHDWCEQVKRAGYQVYYLGISKIFHKGSVSIGGSQSPLKTYYMTRNRLLFARRNFSPLQRTLAITFFTLFSVPKQTLLTVMRGHYQLLRSFYQGIAWNLKN